MAIILEYKDYEDVHEALDLVNEGFFDNLWNKIKDKFKGISGGVDAAIASSEIDGMLDPKTGELTNAPLQSINKIKTALEDKNATADTVNAALTQVFTEIDAMVKTGTYFKQSTKFMKDGMITLMDQFMAVKTAGGAATATAQNTGEAESAAMQTGITAEMQKRLESFDKTYNQARDNAKKQAQTTVQELLKKSSSDATKKFINNRFATTETVLLLIEYDIKKLRVAPENLKDLKNKMVATYKVALDSAKQLQTAIAAEKTAGMDINTYNNLKDINSFAKEYPADTPINKGETAADKFVYPYAGLESGMKVVITGYDINAKTVSLQTVGADGKPVANDKFANNPVPFEDFKSNLLAGSNNIPPVKQKGNATNTKPAAPVETTAAAGAEPKAG